MENSEVMKRVIGILTHNLEYLRAMERDPGAEAEIDDTVVSDLLNEVMPRIVLPADTTPEEISAVVSRAVTDVVDQLVGSFSAAFLQLAHEHDAGRTDVSSSDVLRELALRATTLDDDDT